MGGEGGANGSGEWGGEHEELGRSIWGRIERENKQRDILIGGVVVGNLALGSHKDDPSLDSKQ